MPAPLAAAAAPAVAGAMQNIPAINLPNQVIDMGLGMLAGAYSDKRQRSQARKLQRLQIQGQKEMGLFNQGLALDTWNKTNYEAQRKHMEAAGLNVGLMYEGGGAGGTTQGGGGGNVSGQAATAHAGQTAGMAMQLGLASRMQEAQIKNIEANTQKTITDTQKTAGVDTQLAQSNIQQIAAQTNNEKLKGALIALETDMKQLEVERGQKTLEDLVKQAKGMADRAEADAIKAQVEAGTADATQQDVIKQIRQATTEQMLRIGQQQRNLKLTDEQIKRVGTEINVMKQANMREWDKMSQQDRDRAARTIGEKAGLQDESLIGFIKDVIMIW